MLLRQSERRAQCLRAQHGGVGELVEDPVRGLAQSVECVRHIVGGVGVAGTVVATDAFLGSSLSPSGDCSTRAVPVLPVQGEDDARD